MKIINRDLSPEKDGVPGYLAYPDGQEPGPAVMIVHHHYGVTGHMKATVCNFAKLGYTTIVPDLYKMLGAADGVHEAQKNTTDGQFVEILNIAGVTCVEERSRCQTLRRGRLLHGRADRHSFRCGDAERARFCRLLSFVREKVRASSVHAIPTTRSTSSNVRRRFFSAAKTTSPAFRCNNV